MVLIQLIIVDDYYCRSLVSMVELPVRAICRLHDADLLPIGTPVSRDYLMISHAATGHIRAPNHARFHARFFILYTKHIDLA